MYFLEDLDEEEYEIAIKVSKDFYYYLQTSMYYVYAYVVWTQICQIQLGIS